MAMYVLFEHASGFGLFSVKEFEEISMLQSQVEKNVTEFGKFAGLIKLHAFSPFKSGANALDNMNCISEGLLHDDLKLFLDTNLSERKGKVILGVGDSKIGAAIQEELGITCQTSGVASEIIRGLRYHFPRFVKGLSDQSQSKAQLGLGHSYSRAKVKFNVHRVDNMIIQSISLLDQLDKDVNTFSMRIKEWYSYHFPELAKIVSENAVYAKVVHYIQDRKNFTEDKLEGLEELVMDSTKATAIYDAHKSSMGMDISPIDLINIASFSTRVISLSDYRKKLFTYLQEKMHAVAPNLTSLIGEQVGARLISHAGSLTNLAKYPASTVQILGAEKALFRALKTKGNTPKYGLIFHSTFIGRAAQKNKGRISRYLANKCSIASRIDCFADVPTSVYGEKLKQQVEDRLKFYESGVVPEKNLVVMQVAATESALAVEAVIVERKRQEKQERKRKRKMVAARGDSIAPPLPAATIEEIPSEEPPKKKKKNKKKAGGLSNGGGADESVKEENNSFMMDTSAEATPVSEGKKKKKKQQQQQQEEENGDEGAAAQLNQSVVSMDTSGGDLSMNSEKKKKKKKKKRSLLQQGGDE
ncbi:nucleolar protein 56-like [Apostichopus japonicus]|uniref:nucleolar protein 56-like n=1 Tax=Stichopus japonicus TaxID=307972 RepID=UPI003AB7BC0C